MNCVAPSSSTVKATISSAGGCTARGESIIVSALQGALFLLSFPSYSLSPRFKRRRGAALPWLHRVTWKPAAVLLWEATLSLGKTMEYILNVFPGALLSESVGALWGIHFTGKENEPGAQAEPALDSRCFPSAQSPSPFQGLLAPEMAEAGLRRGTRRGFTVTIRSQNAIVLFNASCPFLSAKCVCLFPLSPHSMITKSPARCMSLSFLPRWTGPEGSGSPWRSAEDLGASGIPTDDAPREMASYAASSLKSPRECPFLMLYEFLLETTKNKPPKVPASRNFRNRELEIICSERTANPAQPF